eukprot:6737793-Alexandrium_andersonii.AAC.1
MWKWHDSRPVSPRRPPPRPIDVNCWQGDPPAMSNAAFAGMLSTNFRNTAPRPPSNSRALLARLRAGIGGPRRPALAHQRTTASDGWV